MHYLRQKGLRVTTEAEHGDRGQVDVLCHGPPDGAPYAVELETSPTEKVVTEKFKKYIENSPLREMYLINVNDCPENILEAYQWICEQLP